MTNTSSRQFGYARVSAAGQSRALQTELLQKANPNIQPNRIVSEHVSGAVPAMERPAFSNMINHSLESGDTLTVLKLDRLGRNTADILTTVELLAKKGIKVVSMDVAGTELTSTAGKMILTVLVAVAELERAKIAERTTEGRQKAMDDGVKFGRKPNYDLNRKVHEMREEGWTQKVIANELGVSLPTVKRHCQRRLEG